MKIETKFDVGEIVYVIEKEEQQDKYVPCSICNGNKIIKIENKPELKCPYCSGYGNKLISYSGLFKIIEKDTFISAVYIYVYEEKQTVFNYRVESYGNQIPENKLFKTKEEAQLECDRLNKLEESK